MPGRPRIASDEEIFAAVGDALSDTGPAGLTLAAVAGRCGLTASALTYRFGSKQELFLAFARDAATSVTRPFERARRTAANGAVESLHQALAELVRPVSRHEALAHHLAMLHLDVADPDLRAHAAEHQRRFHGCVEALLADAVDRGELRADTDPVALAHTVGAVYHGTLVIWAVDGDGDLFSRIRTAVDRALHPYRAERA